tara:strand:- start:607 stop:984 length:378 start_codon:yes stop_codon:yes gene_type:complete
MTRVLPLAFLLLTAKSLASDISSVHIVRITNGDINQEIILPFGESKSLMLNEVWRSPVGIVCRASAYEQKIGLPKGAFECESKEGYKAQIGLDCSQHKNKKTSAYLFFGLIGKFDNIGNFYVWCE